jgi:hypothetical protein
VYYQHGQARRGQRTPLHRLWLAIRNRCNNPKTPDFKYYGGRGIRVCARWDRFVDFVEDVGPHPGSGWTLDRKDNDGDYEPGNVRWATRLTQARNRNYCKLNEDDAEKIRKLYSEGIVQTELAIMFSVHQTHISAIIRRKLWA